ncbi:MAG: hypothetical protein ACWA44_15170 [Thiotrichales bacterium]
MSVIFGFYEYQMTLSFQEMKRQGGRAHAGIGNESSGSSPVMGFMILPGSTAEQ